MHLPAKNVFAAQRVSRQFRDVIEKSARIQQRLFLRPSGVKPLTWILEVDPGEDIPENRYVVCQNLGPLRPGQIALCLLDSLRYSTSTPPDRFVSN